MGWRIWLPATYLVVFLSGMATMAEAAEKTEGANAEALYKEHCVACHGENRLGGVGPALLPENPDPSRDEIRHNLEGNICRCTGYQMIVNSVRWAAEHPDGVAVPTPGGAQ